MEKRGKEGRARGSKVMGNMKNRWRRRSSMSGGETKGEREEGKGGRGRGACQQ